MGTHFVKRERHASMGNVIVSEKITIAWGEYRRQDEALRQQLPALQGHVQQNADEQSDFKKDCTSAITDLWAHVESEFERQRTHMQQCLEVWARNLEIGYGSSRLGSIF